MLNNEARYSSVANCLAPPSLQGRTVIAVHSDYCIAALLLDNEEVIAFAAEEMSAGKWFEVFPLRLHPLTPGYPTTWIQLARPLSIALSERIWREEWLESGSDVSGLLGSGPHYIQCGAGLGAAPASAGNLVKVCAGLRLTSVDGRALLICSSDSTPFKVDLTVDPAEQCAILSSHTCEQISLEPTIATGI